MDIRTLLIADEGFISDLKDKFAEKKAEKADVARIKAELKAMEPKQAATKIFRAMLAHTADGCTILKEDPNNELEQLYHDSKANPGKIHPEIPYLIKINGYPVLMSTTINKETGREEFSTLFYIANIPKNIQQRFGIPDSIQSDIMTLHQAAVLMSVHKIM